MRNSAVACDHALVWGRLRCRYNRAKSVKWMGAARSRSTHFVFAMCVFKVESRPNRRFLEKYIFTLKTLARYSIMMAEDHCRDHAARQDEREG